MLTDYYIREAMRVAHYEMMENGHFFATIPPLEGLWAEGATLEQSREELQSMLEDWIMIKLRFGDRDFPAINGIDLNPQPEYAETDQAVRADQRMRLLGWQGPHPGKRHSAMRKGTRTLPIPNPHGSDLDWILVKRILKQAQIDPDEWERLK